MLIRNQSHMCECILLIITFFSLLPSLKLMSFAVIIILFFLHVEQHPTDKYWLAYVLNKQTNSHTHSYRPYLSCSCQWRRVISIIWFRTAISPLPLPYMDSRAFCIHKDEQKTWLTVVSLHMCFYKTRVL